MFNSSKELIDIMKKTATMSSDSQAKLKESFFDGLAKMDISAVNTANSVIDAVNKMNQAVMDDLNKMFENTQTVVTNMHTAQSEKKPKDFTKEYNEDIKEKESTGFPFEDVNFFKNIPSINK